MSAWARTAPAATVACGLLVALGSCGGEGLPGIYVTLSKNCNAAQVDSIIPAVSLAADEQLIDIATDSSVSDEVWMLISRGTSSVGTVVVQRRLGGVIESEHEISPNVQIADELSLQAAPEEGVVWVVWDTPGEFQLWRVDPLDPVLPVQGSESLVDFPTDGPLCTDCDSSEWPRRLFFMSGVPAVVSLPTFSIDAGLIVWVGRLDMSNMLIRMGDENRLNFEPPCDDSSPEAQTFCEEQRENLLYPDVTLLDIQDDPRLEQTVLLGHRTRSQTYDGDPFPLETADVFMVSLFLDPDNKPEGVLRSYSGFYSPEGPLDASAPPLPSASPPFGIAIDRFAAYGLFSNGGTLPRLIQLPASNPEFEELSGRIPLELDTQLLQMDRDLAMGRIIDGSWEITKLFPDEPAQSEVMLYGSGITDVVSGGVGTFLLRKQDAAPEIVRLRCPTLEPELEQNNPV